MTASSPRPDPRDFRKRLVAREPLLGSFLKFTVPQPSEILGQIGYDFVMLDEEHAPWTLSLASSMNSSARSGSS